MIRMFADWFEEKCPTCQEHLHTEKTPIHSAKACTHGHYRIETYHHLGVLIVYRK